MKTPLLVLGALALAVLAEPAAAQERDVFRRSFTFLDDDVTIEVLADAPGTLRVVRGEAGRLDAAGQVPGGFSTVALGGIEHDHLRLTALGGDRADFLVVVPERAVVRVQLPGQPISQAGSMRPGATFSWNVSAPGARQSSARLSGTAQPSGSMSVVAYSSARAPASLTLANLTTVRTVTVRMEGNLFQIAGKAALAVRNATPQQVEVSTGTRPEDVVVTVPADVREFSVQLANQVALKVSGGTIQVLCQPVIDQQLPGGRRWFTFSPEAGRLECRKPASGHPRTLAAR